MNENNAAIEAIAFALKTDEGLAFLRCWNEGDFNAIREEWPEAPESVFVGADPLHPKTSDINNNKEAAINIAVRFGGFEQAHHKAWVIDQMVRALAGVDYDQIVKDTCHGEDGADTYTWNKGITP